MSVISIRTASRSILKARSISARIPGISTRRWPELIFVVNAEGKLLRKLTLPSPGVPNLAFSPDEKTLYVTALDELDKSPYRGKVYSHTEQLTAAG